MTPLCALFPCTFSFVFVLSNASCSWCSLALGVWESAESFPLSPDSVRQTFSCLWSRAPSCGLLLGEFLSPALSLGGSPKSQGTPLLCSLSGIIAPRGTKHPWHRHTGPSQPGRLSEEFPSPESAGLGGNLGFSSAFHFGWMLKWFNVGFSWKEESLLRNSYWDGTAKCL